MVSEKTIFVAGALLLGAGSIYLYSQGMQNLLQEKLPEFAIIAGIVILSQVVVCHFLGGR